MSARPIWCNVVSDGAPTAAEWRELAIAAEALGYRGLLISDHMRQPLAPVPALVDAAAATTTLRLGTYVLCQGLRNPSVLAREIETADLLSDGRIDLGIGAGWLAEDFDAAGLTPPTPAERVQSFIDALATLERSFTTRPRPPLLIGAGRRRMLQLAARTADTVSITPGARGNRGGADHAVSRLDRKLDWIREAVGDDVVPRIDHVIWECFVTPRPEAIRSALGAAMGVSADVISELPYILIGSPRCLAETLIARRDRWGIDVVSIPAQAMHAFAPVLDELRGA